MMLSESARSRILRLLGGAERVQQGAIRSESLLIFAYGSQARGDFEADSDVELGVISRDGGSGSAQKFLESLGRPPSVRAFSFSIAALQEADPDVPFTRRIFTAELRFSAVTIFGEPVARLVPIPLLRPSDLIEEHAFIRARILDSMICARAGATNLAVQLAWKASFMAARLFILTQHRVLMTNRHSLREANLDGVEQLIPWMDGGLCRISLERDPDSVRGLMAVVTGPLLTAVRGVGQAFYPMGASALVVM